MRVPAASAAGEGRQARSWPGRSRWGSCHDTEGGAVGPGSKWRGIPATMDCTWHRPSSRYHECGDVRSVVVSLSDGRVSVAARERSLLLIVPAEDTAAAECIQTTARGCSKDCSRCSTAGGKPSWRERPARGVSEVSLRALEITCTGRRNIHFAGRDDSPVTAPSPRRSCPTSTSRRRARRPRSSATYDPGASMTPGQEHPKNRDPPDLGPPNPRKPRAISHTQISIYP